MFLKEKVQILKEATENLKTKQFQVEVAQHFRKWCFFSIN
jgi:hypothetical protein